MHFPTHSRVLVFESILFILSALYSFYTTGHTNFEMLRTAGLFCIEFSLLALLMLILYRHQRRHIDYSYRGIDTVRVTLHTMIIPYPYGIAIAASLYETVAHYVFGGNASELFTLVRDVMNAVSLSLLAFGVLFELTYLFFLAQGKRDETKKSPLTWQLFGIPIPMLRSMLISFLIFTGLVLAITTLFVSTAYTVRLVDDWPEPLAGIVR